MSETAPPSGPMRKPILVERLVFPPDAPVTVPGKAVTSALARCDQPNRNRHRIEYHPWLRAFWIEFVPLGSRPAEYAYIHESRVMSWVPVEIPAHRREALTEQPEAKAQA